MFDGETFGKEMVEIVRGYVAAELEPLREELKAAKETNAGLIERLAAVEEREPPDVSSFCDAEAVRLIVGKLAPEIVSPELEPLRAAYEITIATSAEFEVRLAAVEAREIPEAIKGEPGEPGEPGERGEPGEKGEPGEVDMDAVKALIAEAVAELPPPEKGEPGEPGKKGDPGEPGKDGEDGKDGVGLANALKADGCLTLVMTDGSTRDLGRIDGKDGATFDLDDFDIVPIDERSIKLMFTKGEVCHSFELEFPVPIYRGVFSENDTYARGDMVTWAGSQWHCDEPKGLKPGEPESGWALAVKKGRDGRDALKAA